MDELADVFPSQAMGGLSCQSFHQRTLAASSSAKAKITCYAAAVVLPLVFGLPTILLGAGASSTGKSSEWMESITPDDLDVNQCLPPKDTLVHSKL